MGCPTLAGREETNQCTADAVKKKSLREGVRDIQGKRVEKYARGVTFGRDKITGASLSKHVTPPIGKRQWGAAT